MKKLFIFDLDGTLVNSIYDLADSMNAVLFKYGFPVHDAEQYKYFVGNGTLKLVERAVPENERELKKINKYHCEFSKEYNKRCIEKTKPYEGIIETVKMLRSQNCLTAVASNKPDNFVKFIVKNVFGDGLFDAVKGKKDGVPAKPAPDIIFEILNKLDIEKENAVMAGDSNVDVETAHNSGIECIGCSWGFRGRKELENAGAEFIADKPFDILNFT